MSSYQINHLHVLNALIPLAGKRVLEVGGATPAEAVVGHYRCKGWVCVDDRDAYVREAKVGATRRQPDREDPTAAWAYWDGRFEQRAPDLPGPFDVIYSSAVLEHIGDLPRALVAMRDALHPGGRMFHAVGPIWSGPHGYHVYDGYFAHHGADAGRRVLSALRPWMHLLKTPAEMRAHLATHVGEELARDAVESIYLSSRLNRWKFEAYLEGFAAAGLRVTWLRRWRRPWTCLHARYALARLDCRPEDCDFDTFWAVLER